MKAKRKLGEVEERMGRCSISLSCCVWGYIPFSKPAHRHTCLLSSSCRRATSPMIFKACETNFIICFFVFPCLSYIWYYISVQILTVYSVASYLFVAFFSLTLLCFCKIISVQWNYYTCLYSIPFHLPQSIIPCLEEQSQVCSSL
jgi:hypothetical protein